MYTKHQNNILSIKDLERKNIVALEWAVNNMTTVKGLLWNSEIKKEL